MTATAVVSCSCGSGQMNRMNGRRKKKMKWTQLQQLTDDDDGNDACSVVISRVVWYSQMMLTAVVTCRLPFFLIQTVLFFSNETMQGIQTLYIVRETSRTGWSKNEQLNADGS